MTKTRSLTLAPDPVARMREIHDLDNPSPVSPTASEDKNTEALQHENAATQKHSNVETPPPRSAETPEHSLLTTPPEASIAENPARPRKAMIGLQDRDSFGELYGDQALTRFLDPAQEQSNTETQKSESAETPQQGNAETVPHRNAATKKRSSVPAQSETLPSENPVREAMRQALIQPYSADLSKGPTTATTIRIPTEIWERLDMASTLENQTKQDIIAEALKLYLKRIGRGEA